MLSSFILQLSLSFCCLNSLVFITARVVLPSSTKLMPLLLERSLAHADAAKNFVIAPQELLRLYMQLYAANGMPEAEAETEGTAQFDAESQTERTNETTNTTPSTTDSHFSDSVEEYEEFFTFNENAIVVSNVLHTPTAQTIISEPKPLRLLPQCRADKNSDSECSELINTVSIHSRWAHNFQKRDTHKRQFYMAPLAHVYTDAMRKDDIFPYAVLPALNASALELSLQLNHMKMLLLLPHDMFGLPHLLQQLSTNVSLIEQLIGGKMMADVQTENDTIRNGGQLWPTLTRLFLPKFQFKHRLRVDGIFRELLNVTGHTELSDLAFIPTIVHESQIAVSEDGIGDLEQTMVIFWNAFASMRAIPLKFKVNHPFMFIIYNRNGIQILGHLAELHVLDH